ncbi:hypothetical protein [Corynebacterium sputi]|uniref:hypothetical protein n=1 Tax=Corynebacterium sputi TaxID=489915 RepID=UPI00041691FE|nr:hypothetical protein [Corynebacterium sputi]
MSDNPMIDVDHEFEQVSGTIGREMRSALGMMRAGSTPKPRNSRNRSLKGATPGQMLRRYRDSLLRRENGMDVSAQAEQYGQELTDRGLPKTAKTWMQSLEGKDIWGNGRIVQQRQDQQMIDAVQQARLAQSEAESAALQGQQGAQAAQQRARSQDSVAQADQSEEQLRSRARAARQERDVQALGAVEMQRMRASAEREKAQEQATQRQLAEREREEAEKARAQAQRQAEQNKSQQGQSGSGLVGAAISAGAAAAAVSALATAIESSSQNQQFYDSWMDDMLAAQSIEDDQEYFATRKGLIASFDERFGDVPEYADNPIFATPVEDTEAHLEGAPEEIQSAMARMEDLSYLDEAQDAMSTDQANDYLQSVDEFADKYDQWCEDRGILGEFAESSDDGYSLPVSAEPSAAEEFAHPLADIDVAGAIAEENAMGSDDLFESVSMEETVGSQEALEA